MIEAINQAINSTVVITVLVAFLVAVTVLILGKMMLRHFKPLQSQIEKERKESERELRGHLAQAVTTGALVAVALIAISILLPAGLTAARQSNVKNAEKFMNVGKDVLSMLLPVIGAWVGTVLAFYFGKENFTAATEGFSKIARQLTSQEKLGQTPVEKIGKGINDAIYLQYDTGDKDDTMTLDKLES